jgi:hypothetical protein
MAPVRRVWLEHPSRGWGQSRSIGQVVLSARHARSDRSARSSARPHRWALAPCRLPQPVAGPDGLAVRLSSYRPRASAHGRAGAGRVPIPDGPPLHAPGRAFPPGEPVRRGMGGQGAAATAAHRRGPRPRGTLGVRPRVRAGGSAVPGAVVRRRVSDSGADRLLRHGAPDPATFARAARATRGGQWQARTLQFRCAVRRPGPRGWPGPGADRTSSHWCRCPLIPRVGSPAESDPGGRASRGTEGESRGDPRLAGDRRGSPRRADGPHAARDCRTQQHIQPLSQPGRRGPHAVRHP